MSALTGTKSVATCGPGKKTLTNWPVCTTAPTGTVSFAVIVRAADSAADESSATVTRRRVGASDHAISNDAPTLSAAASDSGTPTSISKAPRPSSWSSGTPGAAKSPTSTNFFVTTPAKGARTVA